MATKKVTKKKIKKPSKKTTPKKKVTKKIAKRKSAKQATEIIVRVEQQNTPSTEELAQPMMDGKALTIEKTWVSDKQIMRMVQNTPRQHVYTRPAKGGGEWKYVTGSYIEKVLNFVFGFLWDFEVLEHGREGNQIWVKGRLTVKSPSGQSIIKTQFGRADIKFKKNSKTEMLDFGNDLKAATTDSLKKCASLLGIASDIYAPTEYKGETGKEPRQEESQEVPDTEKVIDAETNDVPVEYLCHGATKSGCGADITRAENDFSKSMFGKPLCRNCQKLIKESK